MPRLILCIEPFAYHRFSNLLFDLVRSERMHVLIRRIDVSDVRLHAYKEADILRLTPRDVQPNNHLSIERRSFDRFLMSCFEKHDEKVFGMIV